MFFPYFVGLCRFGSRSGFSCRIVFLGFVFLFAAFYFFVFLDFHFCFLCLFVCVCSLCLFGVVGLYTS